MQVHFHAIAAGGDAVGRDESGRVVFAPYAAPGEVAEVVLTAEHRTFAQGRIVRLETTSPQRVAPPCPFYLPQDGDPQTACGGCQLQHLDYAAQLEAKRAMVRDALQRIGGVAEDIVAPCLAAPLPFGYRNKADCVAMWQDGQPKIGFFARETHRVVDVTHCLIQQGPNNQLRAAVRDGIAAGLIAPVGTDGPNAVLQGFVARTASHGETLLKLHLSHHDWPQKSALLAHLRAAVPSLVGILGGDEGARRTPVLWGRDWLEEAVLGLRWRVTGTGFFQVNTSLTPALLETALRLADVQPGQRALDLFCGVGLFALALARQGATVRCIEANPAAVRDAVFNFRQNGLKAEFRVADAAAELRRLKPGEWDIALLDPPRAGATKCIKPLRHLRPRRIIYVSCDPATLARDVKTLATGGYRLVEAVPLDLFPQTAHVETVARLERVVD